jgi:NAD(P)H dehydrogenase (quinone)
MATKEQIASRPRVLILGSKSRIGSNVIAELERINTVEVVHSSRKLEQVGAWRRDGKNAVLLGLDQPDTFPEALSGIDRVIYSPPATSDPFGRSSHKEK